ncbi:MAG: hypothetical protein H6Q57_102 [Geobacteraceae bacterium]|nr:hypothetical protein [Geobacteraceae bacterium]
MKAITGFSKSFCVLIAAAILTLGMYSFSAAHCDTLDGPVIQDARKALDAKDVTPVLKWVRSKDEKSVKVAFNKALAARGKKQQKTAETNFFETLVKIHRAGEGAPFTGLKAAGTVEPVIAEADKSLAAGSAEAVVKLVTDAVGQGIRQRYEKAAETYKHKDESVQKGREFVAAYIEYTHYVERLHIDASSATGHHAGNSHKEHATPGLKHDH